jgi:hypothetical protein
MNNIMTVLYAPGRVTHTPMIRIANQSLIKSGFIVGSKYEAVYTEDVITIRKITKPL